MVIFKKNHKISQYITIYHYECILDFRSHGL